MKWILLFNFMINGSLVNTHTKYPNQETCEADKIVMFQTYRKLKYDIKNVECVRITDYVDRQKVFVPVSTN